MPKTDLMWLLAGSTLKKISDGERSLFEVVLISRIYQELTVSFINKHKKYSTLTRNYIPMEGEMSETKFIQEMVIDILSSEEYSVSGIANYTHVPEDVIIDLASGLNAAPTFEMSRKIFELHASVRKELYDNIIRKIIVEYQQVNP